MVSKQSIHLIFIDHVNISNVKIRELHRELTHFKLFSLHTVKCKRNIIMKNFFETVIVQVFL